MRKFYVSIGVAVTNQGPMDMMKDVTADKYVVDSAGNLVFYKNVQVTKLVETPQQEAVDENYCMFKAWNFVYSEDAIPAQLLKASGLKPN